MSWAVGFDSNWNRDIGYGVPCSCDYPDCTNEIDRGLSYVCGNEPYGGEHGCGLFFCDKHLYPFLCYRCVNHKPPFSPKPDLEVWLQHKATDPSWQAWRDAQKKVSA